MSEKLYLPHSNLCFVCGCDNPHGLKVNFYTQDGKVHVDLLLDKHYNGYENVAHGGVLSALLDEAMGWAAFIFSDSKEFFFTRELCVTYKKNVPIGVPLLVTTEFVEIQRGGIASARGKITDMDGKIYTTSKGLFFPVPAERMEQTKSYLIFDEDKKHHPKAIEYCKA